MENSVRKLNLTLGLTLCMIVASLCTACEGGSGAQTAAEGGPVPAPSDPGVTPEQGTPVSITVKSGSNFDVFLFEGDLYGRSTDDYYHEVKMASFVFVRVVSGASPVTDLSVRDDSYCYSVAVAELPQSRLPGNATYCTGEGNLNWPYTMYPIVYSGPPFGAAHGSSDLTWTQQPIMGGELSMDTLLNQTAYSHPILSDGSGLTSEVTLSCEKFTTELVCPDFTMSLE